MHTIIDSFKILFYKDPCKKCLVKTVCKDICPEKSELNWLLFPEKSLKSGQIWCWFLILGIVFSFSGLMFLCITHT